MTFRPTMGLLLLSGFLFPVNPSVALESEKNSPSEKTSTMRVLFIGNSYTARHDLANVVEAMAEERLTALDVEVTTVIYGGRTLSDHWRLGTQHILNQHQTTANDVQQTLRSLRKQLEANSDDRHARAAIKRQADFLQNLDTTRAKWDAVVLQSYRDDLDAEQSLYVKYAPRFAALAHGQGARVILYETTPTTQNKDPISDVPDAGPIHRKARIIAKLANEIDASVAPMSLVALRCQMVRPDLTLRFQNDAHLNQTMAYLSACAIYAALFDRSPEGLNIDSITDIRFFNDKDRSKDRDGAPITRKFSATDRADLQRIAWQSHLEFQKLKQSLGDGT